MVNSKVLISSLTPFVPGANFLNEKEERPVGKLLLLLCLAIHKIPQKCNTVPGSISILSSIPLTPTSKISHLGDENRSQNRWEQNLTSGTDVLWERDLNQESLCSCASARADKSNSPVSSVIMLMANFVSKNIQARVQPLSLHLDSYKGTFWGTRAVPVFMLYRFSKLFLLWFMPMIQKAYQTIMK